MLTGAQATAAEVWAFQGMDPHDPSSWYDPRPGAGEMYHGSCQWQNRTAPGVHEAFAQIWGTERLWCSHDRVNIKPPTRSEEERALAAQGQYSRGLHWRVPLRLPLLLAQPIF
eukprot:COSAG03_NODE_169_length_11255_cov_5.793385_14_plen_113_part_00